MYTDEVTDASRVTPKRVLRDAWRSDRGLTLIELMVALVITMATITGLLLIFTSGIKNQVMTERVDRATGTTQVIVSKAREVDFTNLGFYTSTDAGSPSATVTSVSLPISSVGATGVVGAALSEAPVELGTVRPAGVLAFADPVKNETIDGVDYRTTTTVTWVPNADLSTPTAKRVTVVSKWGVHPANFAAACDTSGIRCTTQSLVRTATASDMDPVTGARPADTCVAGAKVICEAYIRSGRVLDGATMASVTDAPQQVADVDLFVRTASAASGVSATWTWTSASGSVYKTVTETLSGGADATRWAYTLPADATGSTYKGDVRPGSTTVHFTANFAGTPVSVDRPAFWSYSLGAGAEAISANIVSAANWCSVLGTGTPITFAVAGHSIGFTATTQDPAAKDTVDAVFTTTTGSFTKTVTVPAVVDPASITPQDLTTGASPGGTDVVGGWVNANWVVTAPATDRCDNRAVTVMVHRSADQTTTPVPLRLSPSVVTLSAPSLTLAVNQSTGTYTVTWPAVTGATGYAVQTSVAGGAAVASTTTTPSLTGTLAPGQALTVAVTGTAGTWSSPVSTISGARVPAAPVVTASRAANVATFTWAPVPGATAYQITTQVPPAAATAAVQQAGTTFTLNVDRGQTGWIGVVAVNAGGGSSNAAASSTTPLWEIPSLQNGWVNYDAAHASAKFTRTSAGVVVLSGLIRNGSTAASTTLFTLPPGYRPSGTLILSQATNGTTVTRIDIDSAGNVVLISPAAASSGWVSLDGASFLAVDAPTSLAPLTPINGWANYGNWAPIASGVDKTGRVIVQGLLLVGSVVDSTPIATLPAGQTPNEYLHLQALDMNAPNTLSVSPNGVLAKTTNAGWISSQLMFYPAARAADWSDLPLQNGWVTYAGYATPQFIKGADGIVSLKGLIRAGTVSAGTVIATLPVGYRPAQDEIFAIANDLHYARIDVFPNGDICAWDGLDNVWAALESIHFMAEQ